MIEILNRKIEETTTEYAVEIDKGKISELLVDCDTLEEAETFAKNFGTKVLERRCYMTEWYPREQPV
jgi:hypothetical protein